MALPSVSVTVKDGNLGLVPSSPGQTQLKIAPATSGIGTITPLASKADLLSSFTSGPVVDCASLALDMSGRGPLFALRPATSTAGSAGSITKTQTTDAVGVASPLYGEIRLAGADANGNVLFQALDPDVTLTVTAGGSAAYAVVGKAITLTVTNTLTGTQLAALSLGGAAGLISQPTALGTGASVCGQTLATTAFSKGGLSMTPKQLGVRVRTVLPGGANANLSVTLSGSDISINLGTDADSQISPAKNTGTLVKAALDAAAGALLTTSLAGDGAGMIGQQQSYVALTFGSTGSFSVSGTPLDAYQFRGRIVKTGTLNTGSFRYSLDGGDSESEELAIPAGGSYVVPGTGLTLTFTANGGPVYFQAGDSFSFDCAAPAMTLSDLTAALDIVLADPRAFGLIHIVGSISPTIFAALATYAASFESAGKYPLFICEAAPPNNQTDAQWSAALISDYAASANIRIAVCANQAETIATVQAPMGGRFMKRNSAWALSARAGAVSISTDVGKVLDGPLLGVSAIHQKGQSDTLDTARFSTVYEIVDYQGYYGQGKLMSPSGSDFVYWQDIRVISEAQRLTRQALIRFQSSEVRVRAEASGDKPAGSIDPGDRASIEDYLNAILKAFLTDQGHCTAATATVISTDNLLQTKRLRARVDVIPLGYLKTLSAEVGLRNPALTLR